MNKTVYPTYYYCRSSFHFCVYRSVMWSLCGLCFKPWLSRRNDAQTADLQCGRLHIRCAGRAAVLTQNKIAHRSRDLNRKLKHPPDRREPARPLHTTGNLSQQRVPSALQYPIVSGTRITHCFRASSPLGPTPFYLPH